MNRVWIGAIVVLAAVLVFVLRGNGDEARDTRQRTARAVVVEIDRGELCYRERFGRYTGRVSDFAIFGSSSPQVRASGERLHIELDASSDGRGYIQRITGEDVDYVVERRGREVIGSASTNKEPQLAVRCPSRR